MIFAEMNEDLADAYLTIAQARRTANGQLIPELLVSDTVEPRRFTTDLKPKDSAVPLPHVPGVSAPPLAAIRQAFETMLVRCFAIAQIDAAIRSMCSVKP